ncbi:MAG TPA: 16S rRNA (adenine(1518)-N(6)/adenine(1519)-N(6))-dimethyltransferase RsmA [Gemmatimonadaceae bacterium]|nr:16S rRNA (adenine(1518)-N(6)/adenine(1519)-N(6))-dimethyltransferase RsmA [Gemmatimonadaceae bacterium]
MAPPPGGRKSNPPVLKRYGQHFLSDPAILSSIVDALSPTTADTVVEVGPGRGSLTDILAGRAGKVVAVEIDRALAEQLAKRYAGQAHVIIVQSDFLETRVDEVAGSDYLLIGNVPYYITTPIIFRALEPPMPRRSVFLVQREVADRMAATEDTEAYGALSVNIAVAASVEMVLDVPRTAFSPSPKVESAVVRVVPLAAPLLPQGELAPFRAFVQACFGLRRKQMQRVLRTVRGLTVDAAAEILERCEIPPEARPEVVSPRQFTRLFAALEGSP